jgi:hypothetical protein
MRYLLSLATPWNIFEVATLGLEREQGASLHHYAAVSLGYVTIAPYSPNWASASLNCSIYYNFLRELPRTPFSRTSENTPSRYFGEYLSPELLSQGGRIALGDDFPMSLKPLGPPHCSLLSVVGLNKLLG